MSESMLPSFPNSTVWPYDVTIQGGQTVRVCATSEREARRKVLARYRKGAKVAGIETVVATSEQINRILAA